MAGIVGIAAPDHDQQVGAALDKIEHRGGAGRLVHSPQGATVGEVWPAAQELYAQGIGRTGVVLDGEVHNWQELAPDAETPLAALAAAYRARGPGFVRELDGPFALAIAGPEGLFLARDVLGKSPLYHGVHQGRRCFASELKALLEWPGSPASELAEFPPGHYYHPEAGLVRYDTIEKHAALDLPEEQIAQELRARLEASVAKRTGAGETGAWLSGGLDSATMAALAARRNGRLHTFAVGVEGAPDLEYAQAVADHIGAEHHVLLVSLEDMLAALPEVLYHLESFDRLLVRSSVMNYLVGRMAAEYVPAVLSGEGGDELFAGYSYLKQLEPEELPDELVDITRRLHNTALQRVDRCSASHGLVARTGFLDREVVALALRIPVEMKLYTGSRAAQPVEKWILRRAMEGLLPDKVVTRTKAKFWEGAGVGDLMAAHADQVISDAEFSRSRRLPDGTELAGKEDLYYYRIFRERFGDAFDPALVGRTKSVAVV